MMTRREILALTGSSVVLKTLGAQDVPFDRIDTHAHIYRSIPALVANMEKEHWRAVSICTWKQFDNQLYDTDESPPGFKSMDELLQAVAKVHRESKGRIAWVGTIDARRFEDRDFTEKTIAGVQQCFKNEAIGIKIWKIVGMKIRGKSGNYLMPDDKALLPVYESIQKSDRTLITHLAEPNGAWLPTDAPNNTYAGYYRQNPEWHMGNQPGAPPKEAILKARDRILARFPKLRVIGCHLGSNEEDFQALAKRLNTYPNFAVDMAARTRHFFGGDPQPIRQFVDKYQDRLIYGSDYVMGQANDERIATAVLAQEDREWNQFASNQKITQRNSEIQCMALPDRLLRKLFHDNAVRWVPGSAPA